MDPTLQAQLLATQAAADLSLLTTAFAAGVASVTSPVGDVTAAQEQLDIAAAVSAQETADAISQAAAVQVVQSQLTALQSSYAALQAQDAIDSAQAALVTTLESNLAALQASVAAIAALLPPVPAPVPPAPVSMKAKK